MKWLMVVLLSLLVVLAPACAMFTPQQSNRVIATLDDELAQGHITQAQHDVAVDAVRKGATGFDWATLGLVGVNIALALVGAPAVVRLQRGPPTQIVGISESLVKPDPVPVTVKTA